MQSDWINLSSIELDVHRSPTQSLTSKAVEGASVRVWKAFAVHPYRWYARRNTKRMSRSCNGPQLRTTHGTHLIEYNIAKLLNYFLE